MLANVVLLTEEPMSARRRTIFSIAVLLCAALSGCLSLPTGNPRTAAPPAVQIPAAQRDQMWERAIAVLHEMHFLVARESKLEGVIETEFRAGSSLLEPWNRDSVGYANRLESTLQSIRRRVTISFQETSPDYIMILVSVDKQIEDVPGLAANYEGGATFSESQPLQRDLDQVIGQAGPSRWLPRGSDPLLEAEIMRRLRFDDLH
ncbi:MAG: hypothetical protein NXI04_05110 [Planctomycetaceae bacterium]|nr:hypothetical protein [Planctomycetaceae bacterium]